MNMNHLVAPIFKLSRFRNLKLAGPVLLFLKFFYYNKCLNQKVQFIYKVPYGSLVLFFFVLLFSEFINTVSIFFKEVLLDD